MPLEFMSFWAAPLFYFIFLGKQRQEFPKKKIGTLVINHFLPKLLVTYSVLKNNYHKGV